MEKANYQKSLELIDKAQERYLLINKVAIEVEKVLKEFEGKKISKRIETALKNNEYLKDFTIHYGMEYSFYKISIWNNGIEYNDKISMNLVHTSSIKTVNLEKIKSNSNQFYFNVMKNYNELEKRKIGLEEDIEKWNKLVDEVEVLRKKLQLYPLSEQFKL